MPGPLRRLPTLVALLSVFAAGALALTARARRRRQLGQWQDSWMRPPRGSGSLLPGDVRQKFEELRRLLMGLSRAQVAEALGKPVTAAMAPGSTAAPKPGALSQEQADVWYYPLDLRRRLALAVMFSAGVVAEVDWMSGPQAL